MKGKEILDECEHRVLDYNPKTGKLWHPPYCALSLDKDYKGKKCKHLGDEITLTITRKYNRHSQVQVNACELGMNHQKPDRSIVNFLKGMFKRAK